VVNICIGKQKVVWILKLRENGWEAATSALRAHGLIRPKKKNLPKFFFLIRPQFFFF
jgi:hypothetical protein